MVPLNQIRTEMRWPLKRNVSGALIPNEMTNWIDICGAKRSFDGKLYEVYRNYR